jgi:hypothetical protein
MMKFPSVFVPAAVWFLKEKVIQVADFDLSRVSPLNTVAAVSCPTVFGHAEADQFVPFSHDWIPAPISESVSAAAMIPSAGWMRHCGCETKIVRRAISSSLNPLRHQTIIEPIFRRLLQSVTYPASSFGFRTIGQ